eukprot:m.265056 g.265056  ORF g.265056 m.265056 type:complete len:347 (+) comp59769_c0_seq1:708-1748(+)
MKSACRSHRSSVSFYVQFPYARNMHTTAHIRPKRTYLLQNFPPHKTSHTLQRASTLQNFPSHKPHISSAVLLSTQKAHTRLSAHLLCRAFVQTKSSHTPQRTFPRQCLSPHKPAFRSRAHSPFRRRLSSVWVFVFIFSIVHISSPPVHAPVVDLFSSSSLNIRLLALLHPLYPSLNMGYCSRPKKTREDGSPETVSAEPVIELPVVFNPPPAPQPDGPLAAIGQENGQQGEGARRPMDTSSDDDDASSDDSDEDSDQAPQWLSETLDRGFNLSSPRRISGHSTDQAQSAYREGPVPHPDEASSSMLAEEVAPKKSKLTVPDAGEAATDKEDDDDDEEEEDNAATYE